MKPYQNMTPVNSALLVIDAVNSCAHENCEIPRWKVHFSKVREMLPKLEKFIEDFRKDIGGLVIFTNCVPWTKEHLAENVNELYTDPATYYYSQDTSNFPLQFYKVSPKEGDLIITKNTYDAFSNPELDKKLEKKGIRYLIVTGIFGDACVLATIVSGFSKGYNFVILKDLIETTDSKTRQKLLEFLKSYTFPIMYGRTITSSQFLKTWPTD